MKLILPALAVLVLAQGSALADKIRFKDGRVLEVEVYEESPTYVCFIHEGKLCGAARSTIESIEYVDEPICDVKKILAEKAAEKKERETAAKEAAKPSAMELLKAEAEAKKKEGSAADRRREQAAILEKVFNPAASSAQGTQGGQAAQGSQAQPQPPASSPGMKVVPPGDSQTGQTEVIIDAFPAGRAPRGK